MQYKFELAETAAMDGMRRHLEECAECRERLGKLGAYRSVRIIGSVCNTIFYRGAVSGNVC